MIAFWRFILGFGIGGDYPLSATITSEYANTRWRGAFIAAVFAGQVGAKLLPSAHLSMGDVLARRVECRPITMQSKARLTCRPVPSSPPQSSRLLVERECRSVLSKSMHVQGIGIVTASIVSLIVVRSFKSKIENDSVLYLDYAWRIIIGLGCVPAIATIYLRCVPASGALRLEQLTCIAPTWQHGTRLPRSHAPANAALRVVVMKALTAKRHSTAMHHRLAHNSGRERYVGESRSQRPHNSPPADSHRSPNLGSQTIRRSQLPETPRFTSEIERDVVKAKSNMNAVFAKSKQYSDEGRIMANDQDRCVCITTFDALGQVSAAAAPVRHPLLVCAGSSMSAVHVLAALRYWPESHTHRGRVSVSNLSAS